MNATQWTALIVIIWKIKGDVDPISGADHDIIFINLDINDVPEESEIGVRFREEFNMHIEHGEHWAKYV